MVEAQPRRPQSNAASDPPAEPPKSVASQSSPLIKEGGPLESNSQKEPVRQLVIPPPPPPPPPARSDLDPQDHERNGPHVDGEHIEPSEKTTTRHEHHTHDETFRGGVHTKQITRLPFKLAPLDPKQSEREGGAWVKEKYEAVDWLSLFYDLVVVAVLATFGTSHEISNPGAIPLYVSYFVIVYRCWTAQIYYDVPYQSEDMYHRICKALQIAAFVYMGAGSGNWAPNRLQNPDSLGLTGDDYVRHRQAEQSFDTVASAFLLYRALLVIQYTVCAVQAHHAGRHRRGLITEACSFFVSGALCLIAILLPDTTRALTGLKLGLFFGALVLEILATNAATMFGWHARVHPTKFAKRYAEFTLIILGEGFLLVTKAFKTAISGVTHYDRDVYLQVCLVVGIIWCLYIFLFARFQPEDSVSQKRGFAWQMIHLPLHLGLLLLLAAMVNVVINLAYTDGVDLILDEWQAVVDDLAHNIDANSTTLAEISLDLDPLQLEPDWLTMYDNLKTLYEMPDNKTDPYILTDQYFGQIAYAVTESYGVKPGRNVSETLNQLQAVNTSLLSPDNAANRNASDALLTYIILQPISKSLSGTLWLFPTAGAVLILGAVRSFLWYRYEGIAHWLLHLPPIILGIGLGLLGVLDRRNQNFILYNNDIKPLNQMYELVFTNWPLAIVALVYCLALFVPMLVLLLLQRAGRGDAHPSEDIDEEEERLVEPDEKTNGGGDRDSLSHRAV